MEYNKTGVWENTCNIADAVCSKRWRNKRSRKIADVFNSFLFSVAENLNLYQVVKEDAISFLKDSFPSKFHDIKIFTTSEAEIKSIILSLKWKKKTHLIVKKQRANFW